MAYTPDRTSLFNASPRLIVGLGLVAFGVLLLLAHLGLLDTEVVLRLWPLIIIAVGLQQFFNPRVGPTGERRFPVNGIIWMAIGGFLLLNTLGDFRIRLWELFWPAVLIAVGVRLMTRGPYVRMRHRMTVEPGIAAPLDDAAAAASGGAPGSASGSQAWQGGPRADAWGSMSGESADTGSIFAVLSAVKRVSAAVPFHGTEVTAFMGGAHIDLRQAIVPRGGEAVIDMFIVVGGCELVVPPAWIVSAPLVAVMGGVDDKRIVPPPSVIEDATAAPPPRLVIRGFVMMGGVTIRG